MTFRRPDTPPASAFLNRLRARVFHPAGMSLTVGTGLVCGVTGPFGSYGEESLPMRLGFWLAIAISGNLMGNGWASAFDAFAPGWSFAKRSAAAGGAFVLTYLPVVLALTYTVFPSGDIPPIWLIFATIVVVAAAVCGVLAGLPAPPDDTPSADPVNEVLYASAMPPRTPTPGSHPILSRLDLPHDARLIRMQMADHYVEVHSTAGSGLLLMRFADAVDLLPAQSGGQVHRSHWVAWDWVDGVERDGKKRFLRMHDGATVPIARARLPALRAQGLLGD
ncbi:MAG: LytTR family DNA-binding domain-containing protein [Pseudomonadota bacterium]